MKHSETLTPPRPADVLRVRSADGTMLHAEVHGPDDAPTVVLSHGWTCSTLFWTPVLRALGPDLRVVLYDQRGHGRSETPRRGGYSTTALADDLCAVLRATVRRGTRVVVAGHSMGGMTIMAAADRPEFRTRVAAALLASTGSRELVPAARVMGGPSRLRSALHRALLAAPLPLGPVTPLTRAGLRYVTMAADAPADMVDLCVRIVHACRPVPRARWGSVLMTLDLSGSLHHLDVPTRVLAGTADRLTPPLHAHRLAEELPSCEDLVLLPGVGHMTPLEAPERVCEVVRGLVHAHLTAPGTADGTASPLKEAG
ncbi:alpha/beta hydrolase [Thermobifida alba]|uniref:Alpha/beta hydrolase n=2 Tax=Thermobifida alba TaxID=53522 RepID=A0ABY4KZM7_THEAE|nr:alpha/beta hydrolase [Thermobifida alba]UPT20893.1 alpha/beta hydrolase [Thermobifida alba]